MVPNKLQFFSPDQVVNLNRCGVVNFDRSLVVSLFRQGMVNLVGACTEEMNELNHASKKHHMSRTRFLKEATFAYINKTFIIPDQTEVRYIRQLLAMEYNTLQEMIDHDTLPRDIGNILLQKISALEKEVLLCLYRPKTLEEWIVETMQKDAKNKDRLLTLIQCQ